MSLKHLIKQSILDAKGFGTFLVHTEGTGLKPVRGAPDD